MASKTIDIQLALLKREVELRKEFTETLLKTIKELNDKLVELASKPPITVTNPWPVQSEPYTITTTPWQTVTTTQPLKNNIISAGNGGTWTSVVDRQLNTN